LGVRLATEPGFAVPAQRGGTIRAPRYINRGDVIPARLSHGETVLDRALTEKLERLVAGGSLGGDVHYHIAENAHFLGTTPREVRREWARLGGPPRDHRSGL